jgi:monomeric sarcosine oxidase
MRTDVIIVGGGLAGSAAAWTLSKHYNVTLLEQFGPGHDRGSSHGSARIFRRAYKDPLYVGLTGEAGRLWDELQNEAGEQVLTRTGSVDFGLGPEPRAMYDVLTAHGVPTDLLTPGEAKDRWPQFRFGPGDTVIYHNEGGVIDADHAISVMQGLAAANGADIRHDTKVTGVDPQTATVTTRDGTHQADTVVIAAGAWLEPLLKGQVQLPELTVVQIAAFHYQVTGEQSSWPTFIRYGDDVIYGLPSGRDVPGAIKLGVHGAGRVTTAEDRDWEPNKAARERIAHFVNSHVDGLAPEPVKSLTCLYTQTPDEDFVIDRYQNAVIVSACSGHGAKFAPLLGHLTKDLVSGNEQRYERFTMNHQLSARLLARAPHKP